MLTIRSLLLLGLLCVAEAAPGRKGNGNGNAQANTQQTAQTAQEQADQIPGGISEATDGSTILDMTAEVNGQTLRFKVSAPADQFTTASGVSGGSQAANATGGSLGLNVLLHGDGGQSFFDFPNQAVQNNLAGVAVLAPDPNLFWGGGSGLDRTDGVAHAQLVNDLVVDVLPTVMAFNASHVSFTGVSGGSLLLSGFFVPAHIGNFADATAGQESQVLLNCGGLTPQVDVAPAAAAAIPNVRMHFQTTQDELALLQPAIPAAIKAYEQLALAGGLDAAAVGALQTVDNSPVGGHCEFDEQDFVSGVQLMADSFASVMQGGDGTLNGTDVNVLNPVVGNEDLVFSGAT
ncbi:Uu.00g112420.m01.CDS01 [Anthostomella pinea]|uniref:Uu.00g112420.m01.CDS01 n=1 Tax=Anthostomella pinea TaxID=933095 RepID=A0AAI8VF70_9PEZI|nr:Uu.00g112420.m01.CDS01 [Anthostomella pinea]